MGAASSKLKCLYLPAQSGKTRKVEELIVAYRAMHECFGDGDVNIFISANNKLLVKQTEVRMTTDLATDSAEGADDATIKGGIFSWMSGDSECSIRSEALAFRMLGEVEMVVLCAHPIRLKYLSELLKLLSACPHFTKKINIWIDEADKSIKLWQKHEKLLALRAVHQLTLVSATFDSVFAKYGELQVMGFLATHPACYRRLKDAIKVEEDYATPDAVDYIRHVLTKHREKLVRPGLRAFIPGDVAKASHDQIAKFLHEELGFVVIIINGERKEILVPGQSPIDLRCYLTLSGGGRKAEKEAGSEEPVEFNAQLARLYKANDWRRFPLAITGFYCVERGVTFQCGPEVDKQTKAVLNDGFLFDYGVIPPIGNKAEAYQTMARLFGNVGALPGYKKVEIYTSTAMFSKVHKQEEMAVNLARMVQEEGLTTVTKADAKRAQNFVSEAGWKLYTHECSSLQESHDYIKALNLRHGGKAKGKSQADLDKSMAGAFYKEATSGEKVAPMSYASIKAEQAKWGKLSSFDPRKVKGSVASHTYVCYKDLTDPASITFITRVIAKVDPAAEAATLAAAIAAGGGGGGGSYNPFD
jgi:hypothetical protein